MDAHFFQVARTLQPKLKQHQVDGFNTIIDYAKRHNVSRLHLAYILATVWHETARWMTPIREGATRAGPNYSNEQAINAVTSIFNKGIISTNYALPVGPDNHSYYGRGLIQITWEDNYKKFNIADDPDKALEWPTALYILFTGMQRGLFTGLSLDLIKTKADYFKARAIVNADTSKNGRKIQKVADIFYDGLLNYEEAAHDFNNS